VNKHFFVLTQSVYTVLLILSITKHSQIKYTLIAALVLLYAFFWVIPRRLNFMCRRFGTLWLFYFHRQVGMKYVWIEKSWSIYAGKRLARK